MVKIKTVLIILKILANIIIIISVENLQSRDTNIIFVVSGREKMIKIIKSALLKDSQNNNHRDSLVYKC